MIEGLQVVSFMPLFDIKTPGNVMAFFTFFTELTNFNIIDMEDFTYEIGYYP